MGHMDTIWKSGVESMVLCSIMFAGSALFVKMLDKHVPILEIVFVRSTIAAIITASFIRRMRSEEGATVQYFGYRKNFWTLLMRGVFGAFGFTLYYFSIQLLPLPDAVVIFFTNVVITAIMSVCMGHEKLTWQMCVGCTTCIAGLVVLTHPAFIFGGETDQDPWKRGLGIGLGVSAAFFASVAFICIKSLGDQEEPIVMTIWFHAAAAVGAIVPLAFSWPEAPVVPTLHEGGLLCGVIITSFLGQLLISRGFQLLSASLAASLNLTQVVYANLLGVLVLHDKLHWYQFAGAACIVAGVLVVQEGRRALQKKAAQEADDGFSDGGTPGKGEHDGGDVDEENVAESLEAQEASKRSWLNPHGIWHGLQPPSAASHMHLLRRNPPSTR